MSIIKISLVLLLVIVSVTVIDCRSIRKRRQVQTNTIPQTASNIFSYGYNAIRDGVMPAINSNINRLSQTWDIYKQNLNQGIDRLSQGWNQFSQNFNWNRQNQYPYNNYNSYGYNNQPYGYGYNNQPYGYGNGYPPNSYQNYGYGYNQQPYYYGRNMPGPQQRYKRNIKKK